MFLVFIQSSPPFWLSPSYKPANQPTNQKQNQTQNLKTKPHAQRQTSIKVAGQGLICNILYR